MKCLALAILCCQVHCSNEARFSGQNCPPFFVHTDNSCHCGFSMDEETALYQWATSAVRCHINANNTYANLNPIYCMSYKEITGVILGLCSYNFCSRRAESQCTGRGLRYVKVPQEPQLINDIMCGEINRTGILCSKCKDGLGPAVLDSMVLMCQIIVNVVNWSPAGLLSGSKSLHSLQIFLLTVYGIWNLDFFRYLVPPFCINENMTTLQIVSLEYLLALYPLLLITVTYILIELHDRGCRVLVLMWRPFHRCYIYFRRQWNPKATIIHAFASFLLLSYVKIIAISGTLLHSARFYNTTFEITGPSAYYVYVDPSLQRFDAHHAPYAALGLFSFLIFTVLPLLLLVLYPLRLTQRFLNALFFRGNFLHEVIRSLQGCYKDGTSQAGGRDLRMFSAIFLCCRIFFILILLMPATARIVGIVTVFVLAPLVTYLKPYREEWCNLWSSFVLITIGTVACAISLSQFLFGYIVLNVLACLPQLYMILLVLSVAARKTHMVNKLKCVYHRINFCPGTAGDDAEDSLPYRLIQQ